ncbi:MAG: hypothetical protein ASARMPREDX12_005402 [Alectoria sarmentosa]|nr:MAG: hypothetical protein ASARMPREDX12_005402 [Alectoria sarmentosa]
MSPSVSTLKDSSFPQLQLSTTLPRSAHHRRTKPNEDIEFAALKYETAHQADTANSTNNMDQTHENTANFENGGLPKAQLEAKLLAAVTAGVPQDGTPAYFDWASQLYGFMPDHLARGKFLERLVSENLDWMGLDQNNGSVKVLDYGAGTGFLSQAFAPYVSKILAIDNSGGMVDQFNTGLKYSHPGCEMRAVQGDLIDRYNLHQALDAEIADPAGDFQSFDLVVMCLAIDCFITDAPNDVQYMELVNALDILAGRLKHDGLLIIVDIEKFSGDSDAASEAFFDGRKETGSGSKEVIAALNEIGMEDIAVIENQEFKVQMELFGRQKATHEQYFMVRARKGEVGDD